MPYPFFSLLFVILFIPILNAAGSIPAGHPNKGTLVTGINLSKLINENKKILSSVSPEEFQFGTKEMAQALLAIGNWGEEFKRGPVLIGDVSKKLGGKIALHLTHQRGLDADIGYLVHTQKSAGHRAKKFHNRFKEQFGVKGELGENFDLVANYQLFKNIFQNMEVLSLYVGCKIYDELVEYDKNQASSIMENIYAQKGHEDHFHIRLKCPSDAPDCTNKWWVDLSKTQKKKKNDSANQKFRDC